MESSAHITNKLNDVIRYLTKEQKENLLKFVESLIQKPKKDNSELIDFAGAIPLNEVELMKSAIEEGCENINYDEW
jgi:hypothetical protein